MVEVSTIKKPISLLVLLVSNLVLDESLLYFMHVLC